MAPYQGALWNICKRSFVHIPSSTLIWDNIWVLHTTQLPSVQIVTNAGFRLTCCLPHCRFDDDISSTVQASLAAEGWPSGKQRQANRSITLPLCPPLQIADSWILFNSGAIAARWKAKVALPLRAATLKQQAMITRLSGKAASGKLVWNQHKSQWSLVKVHYGIYARGLLYISHNPPWFGTIYGYFTQLSYQVCRLWLSQSGPLLRYIMEYMQKVFVHIP